MPSVSQPATIRVLDKISENETRTMAGLPLVKMYQSDVYPITSRLKLSNNVYRSQLCTAVKLITDRRY